jgi:tripartite-type tricarboxylate transporter receptor subunit TctC
LENAAKQVDAVPDVVEKLDKTGLEPFYLPGDAYRKFVFNEAITLKALKLR